MSDIPAHKRNAWQYIEAGYGPSSVVKAPEIRAVFQEVLDKCLAKIPDEGEPADGFMYNAHLLDFIRELDKAKDAFCKTLLAFHGKRAFLKAESEQATKMEEEQKKT